MPRAAVASGSGSRWLPRQGPWKGVRDTFDPYDDPANLLVSSTNLDIPDPTGASGAYEWPGFTLNNGQEPIFASTTTFRGQAVYPHPALDGTTTNWIVMAGKLFRVDPSLGAGTFVDVSPAGITISADISTRVYFISLDGQLVVTDGVNRPWIASNLTNTPITGTYIDYDGLGSPWTAFGRPTLYQGSIVFILDTVNGVSRRTDIAWCEPGLPETGYQQTTPIVYDDNATLVTSSASPLTAIRGTNTALYYWRDTSMSSGTGTLSVNFASSATEDSIIFNVGTESCQTIQEFGDAFFFCDAQGRPWRQPYGQAPEPIWHQMRGVVDQAFTNFQAMTGIVATSALETTLNRYLVAIWSTDPSVQGPPTEIHSFDANTGSYMGKVVIGAGIGIECLGTFIDSVGRSTLIVLGTKDASPATSGYVWSMNSPATAVTPVDVATENGLLLTTENTVPVFLTTEGGTQSWEHNGQLPTILATTGRIGYDDETVWHVEQCTVITNTDAPVRVSCQASMTAESIEGIPEPSASEDGTFRLTCGFDVYGRGPQVTVQPLDVTDRWILQSIRIKAAPVAAGVEDA